MFVWAQRKKEGKDSVSRRGEKINCYLDGLDQVFEEEPSDRRVNFGMKFLLQQEVFMSCSDQEAKLVTGSVGQLWLCSVTGSRFPFINKGKSYASAFYLNSDSKINVFTFSNKRILK